MLAGLAIVFGCLKLGWLSIEVAEFCGTLLALPGVHGAVRRWGLKSRLLAELGQYTFAIYLMHLLVAGTAYVLICRMICCSGFNSVPVAVLLIALGVGGPVAIKKYLFGRLPYLDRITD